MKDLVLQALKELFSTQVITIETSVKPYTTGLGTVINTVDTSVKINGEIVFESMGKYQPIEK